ncbi:MAG TPA: alanine--tRNA ligase [Patescibacteria group bacterium]|nr:alanine--tRNA ligase [Patescibacteria group bacterium]
MTAKEIIDIYLSFFEKRGHKKITGSPLVPLNDPTTLFTSSGMQPLITYLLGEKHPSGKRLVDVQNVFRAQDIDEIGDNRHTTFFRMLGNWSLGDYFKNEQLPWFWEFLTKELKLDPKKLYVTVFDPDLIGVEGNQDVPKDETSITIWKELFTKAGLDPEGRIFTYGVEKNWWSRSGTPDNMPVGEPGGPDSEVFYDFGAGLKIHENSEFSSGECHVNCDCGRYLEIGNSVFMQYKKTENGFEELPQRNVDFGGGLERLIAATENQVDMFQTSLLKEIIKQIEQTTGKEYASNKESMRIVADHFISGLFITSNEIFPSNKEQGYVLRRLIRRGLDHLHGLGANTVEPILEAIVAEYSKTDPDLIEKYETIKNVVLEEVQKYDKTKNEAKRFIEKKYKRQGDELLGTTEITPDDAFLLYTTHGLSPTQIKSLGYTFDDQQFAVLMEQHQKLSRTASAGKFKGGLADTQELTIKGHTATHLLHQAIRDLLGSDVHQSGSNITVERVRFDFNFDRKLTDEEIQKLEQVVNDKIKEDLPVHFEMLPLAKAKELNAIGLFGEKYDATVKVYFIGGSGKDGDYDNMYSKEFCGGPHVTRTSEIKSFKITKQEKLGQGLMRLYAVVT